MVLEVSRQLRDQSSPSSSLNTFFLPDLARLQSIPSSIAHPPGRTYPASLEEEREETILRVEDAMLPVPATILSAQDYVDANFRRVQNSADSTFLVRIIPAAGIPPP